MDVQSMKEEGQSVPTNPVMLQLKEKQKKISLLDYDKTCMWAALEQEMERVDASREDFESQEYDMTRCKEFTKRAFGAMKNGSDKANELSDEAAIVIAKASEIFILDLALRSWSNVEFENRGSVERSDLSEAIMTTEYLDLFVESVEGIK